MSLGTITEINLDINQPGISVVHAKQYDTVRQVKAHLFYNGVKWLVPSSNYLAVVAYKKADRIGGFYDQTEEGEVSVSVDGTDRSIIYISLDRQVLTTSGNVNTEITFYDTINQGRLSTFSFIVQVEAATLDELDLSSNPYFNVLADDISAVLNAEANLTGLTASATGRAAGTQPTVTVTGGQGSGNPYNLAFGIPRGDGHTSTVSQYGVSASESVLPSTWVNSIESLHVPDNYLVWTKITDTYESGATVTYYTKALGGPIGPAGVEVSTTEPVSTTKLWINPDGDTYIVIPDLKDNVISSDSGWSSTKITSYAVAYGASQTLTEQQQRQAYTNLGFPTNTAGRLGYEVVDS